MKMRMRVKEKPEAIERGNRGSQEGGLQVDRKRQRDSSKRVAVPGERHVVNSATRKTV